MTVSPNWSARMEEMVSFVGLSEGDRKLIRDSAAIVMENAGTLAESVCSHFLNYPDARKYFVDGNGEVDEERVDANKRTQITWLRNSSAAPMNEGFPRYVAAVGIMHKHMSTHRPGLGRVPARFVIGTVSYYQTSIATLLHDNIPDPRLASQTSIAWNKLLMYQLDLLLASYMDEPER